GRGVVSDRAQRRLRQPPGAHRQHAAGARPRAPGSYRRGAPGRSAVSGQRCAGLLVPHWSRKRRAPLGPARHDRLRRGPRVARVVRKTAGTAAQRRCDARGDRDRGRLAMGGWPSSNDYTAVIQSPQICFRDHDLKTASVERNKLTRMPKVWTGNFAQVYELTTPTKRVAVKCFSRSEVDLTHRYSELAKAIAASKLPYF